jgi:BRCT domain type II-containing protein
MEPKIALDLLAPDKVVLQHKLVPTPKQQQSVCSKMRQRLSSTNEPTARCREVSNVNGIQELSTKIRDAVLRKVGERDRGRLQFLGLPSKFGEDAARAFSMFEP